MQAAIAKFIHSPVNPPIAVHAVALRFLMSALDKNMGL